MAIADFPGNLDIIIQQGFLRKQFENNLFAELGYRSAAVKQEFPIEIGQTQTFTRPGLLGTAITPLDPAANTNFDNGMSPVNYAVEQYVMSINQYGLPLDLNIVSDRVALASRFLLNASRLGESARRSLDTLALQTILNSYMGGNTRVTVTLGSPNITINVDDVRGFEYVIPTSGASSGTQVPVTNSNTMEVSVNGNAYTLVGAARDVVNVSTAISVGGVSGTLTFSGTVLVADATDGNAVLGYFAPQIVRPNNRASTADLISTDILTLDQIRTGVTTLRNNAVPTDYNGTYKLFLSNNSFQQLYRDTEFQILFRGTEFRSDEYRNMYTSVALGCSLVVTNLAPQQSLNALNIQRPIMCGSEVLVEGMFSGRRAVLEDAYRSDLHDIQSMGAEGEVLMVTRKPLDRLAQIISQAYFFIGGWTAPTDQTANPTTIPTASNAYYKRAVIFETA